MPTATDVVKAWTDVDFRATLAACELELALEHPSGSIDAELDQVLGAFDATNRIGCPITVISNQPCCY
jgi:hypothetical protein